MNVRWALREKDLCFGLKELNREEDFAFQERSAASILCALIDIVNPKKI